MGAEFGHFHARHGSTFIDSWGAGPFIISYQGRSWRFEDSDRFGPALLRKNDEIADRQPQRENHPFWRPYHLWLWQGRVVADDSATCLFEEPWPDAEVDDRTWCEGIKAARIAMAGLAPPPIRSAGR